MKRLRLLLAAALVALGIASVGAVQPAYAAGEAYLTVWDIVDVNNPLLICISSTGDNGCDNVKLIGSHPYRVALREPSGLNFKYGKISLPGTFSPAWTYNASSYTGSGASCTTATGNPVSYTCTSATDSISLMKLEVTPTNQSIGTATVELQKVGYSVNSVGLHYDLQNPTVEVRKCSDNSIVNLTQGATYWYYNLSPSTCYKMKFSTENLDQIDKMATALSTGAYTWGWSSVSFTQTISGSATCSISAGQRVCDGASGAREIYDMTTQATTPASLSASGFFIATIYYEDTPTWNSGFSILWDIN